MNELRELLQLAKTYVTISYVMTGIFIFLNLVFLLRKSLRHLWWQLTRKKEIEEIEPNYDLDGLMTDEQKEQQKILKLCSNFKPSCINIYPYNDFYSLSVYKYHMSYDGTVYILNSENVVIRQYLFCQVKFY